MRLFLGVLSIGFGLDILATPPPKLPNSNYHSSGNILNGITWITLGILCIII